jgi:hypothetical protein
MERIIGKVTREGMNRRGQFLLLMKMEISEKNR